MSVDNFEHIYKTAPDDVCVSYGNLWGFNFGGPFQVLCPKQITATFLPQTNNVNFELNR